MTLHYQYPLDWPLTQARHYPVRGRAPLWRAEGRPLVLAEAVTRLNAQIRLLKVPNATLSTDVPLRRDGVPRAGATPEDPGAALDFVFEGQEMVLACDRWQGVAGNVAALAAHIEAVRGQSRWGVGTLAQGFAGFAALPAPMPLSEDDWRALLQRPSTLAEAEASYRRQMRTAHPDAGGNDALASMLNAAIAAARKVLK